MMKQKNWLKLTLFLSLIFVLVAAGCAADNGDGSEEGTGVEEGTGTEDGNGTDGEAAPEEKGTLTFGVTPWTSTIPPTHVAKILLEDMGYTINLQEADAGVVYTGLSRGDIDVFMDSWLPDMHANYMDRYGDSLVDTAVSYPDGELGWVVPEYVDIDSFEDLIGNESMFDGRIYGIEEGAGMTITSREMIEAYDLDFEYVASSEAGMLTQATRMINNEEPVIFLGWRPHPMFVNWDLKVLEDPEKFFEASQVHVITNENVEEEAPEAFEFLSNWSIPVDDIEEMILKIEDGASAEEVAQEWIDNNQDHVNEMLGN
ncbi:glycine betaine ABC transporter substrate-binding protein [Bacillus horti]|uniref:Glycine betaine/proline transport system substrate-binding protein n=1 Tax=Caldalkalibacillus horti TaxID=77523 RepID=A0ABT9VVQ5_9BACI|nr:glycine betaine ABC transporter substrate-binding protein [Bacillus horti]MDQ0165070.1 glycine betaine/proline transport system substrate-binding protein [Bacillus horti]